MKKRLNTLLKFRLMLFLSGACLVVPDISCSSELERIFEQKNDAYQYSKEFAIKEDQSLEENSLWNWSRKRKKAKSSILPDKEIEENPVSNKKAVKKNSPKEPLADEKNLARSSKPSRLKEVFLNEDSAVVDKKGQYVTIYHDGATNKKKATTVNGDGNEKRNFSCGSSFIKEKSSSKENNKSLEYRNFVLRYLALRQNGNLNLPPLIDDPRNIIQRAQKAPNIFDEENTSSKKLFTKLPILTFEMEKSLSHELSRKDFGMLIGLVGQDRASLFYDGKAKFYRNLKEIELSNGLALRGKLNKDVTAGFNAFTDIRFCGDNHQYQWYSLGFEVLHNVFELRNNIYYSNLYGRILGVTNYTLKEGDETINEIDVIEKMPANGYDFEAGLKLKTFGLFGSIYHFESPYNSDNKYDGFRIRGEFKLPLNKKFTLNVKPEFQRDESRGDSFSITVEFIAPLRSQSKLVSHIKRDNDIVLIESEHTYHIEEAYLLSSNAPQFEHGVDKIDRIISLAPRTVLYSAPVERDRAAANNVSGAAGVVPSDVAGASDVSDRQGDAIQRSGEGAAPHSEGSVVPVVGGGTDSPAPVIQGSDTGSPATGTGTQGAVTDNSTGDGQSAPAVGDSANNTTVATNTGVDSSENSQTAPGTTGAVIEGSTTDSSSERTETSASITPSVEPSGTSTTSPANDASAPAGTTTDAPAAPASDAAEQTETGSTDSEEEEDDASSEDENEDDEGGDEAEEEEVSEGEAAAEVEVGEAVVAERVVPVDAPVAEEVEEDLYKYSRKSSKVLYYVPSDVTTQFKMPKPIKAVKGDRSNIGIYGIFAGAGAYMESIVTMKNGDKRTIYHQLGDYNKGIEGIEQGLSTLSFSDITGEEDVSGIDMFVFNHLKIKNLPPKINISMKVLDSQVHLVAPVQSARAFDAQNTLFIIDEDFRFDKKKAFYVFKDAYNNHSRWHQEYRFENVELIVPYKYHNSSVMRIFGSDYHSTLRVDLLGTFGIYTYLYDEDQNNNTQVALHPRIFVPSCYNVDEQYKVKENWEQFVHRIKIPETSIFTGPKHGSKPAVPTDKDRRLAWLKNNWLFKWFYSS